MPGFFYFFKTQIKRLCLSILVIQFKASLIITIANPHY